MQLENTLTVTPLIVALCALMLVALGVRTLLLRRKIGIDVGNSKNDIADITLTRAIRAHGNFSEYVPMALIALILLELSGASTTLLWILGVALIAGRVIHAVGISREPEDYRFRVAGMAITLTVLISTSLRLIGSYV